MAKKAPILVVDSNLHMLSKIYLALIHKKYTVEAANDAEEIMARAQRFKPRLIVVSNTAKNLTPAVYEQLAQLRVWVFLIEDEKQSTVPNIRKLEVLRTPLNLAEMEEKIRVALNLIEL